MYKRGLIVGRFQPLHNGHLYLIKQALTHAEKLVVGIGSTNISNKDNPYTFEIRLKMLQAVLETEKLTNRIDSIFPSPDVPDDNEWLKQTLTLAGKIDVVIGNNEWVNGIFKSAGYPIVTIPFWQRQKHEGKRIRHLMKDHNQEWHEALPRDVNTLLETL